MIIKEFQLSVSINKEALPNFVLFYGPNEGLIRDNILKISETFKQEKVVDEITINGKVIDENKHIIDEETRSFSMFSEQKLIYIENIKEKHLEFFENIEFEDIKF